MNALSDLFPRTRAEILRLLFAGGNQEIHLRDLARLAGLSPAALQKELTSLAAKEFVLTRRDGNRLYYRANTSHPLFPDLSGIVLKTSGIAAELGRALATVDGIDLALIFGSVAAGTASGQSDVDLLIIGNTGLRKLTPALRGVADAIGREINPICITPAEWRGKLQRGDAFAARVSAEPKLWLKGGLDAFAAMEG
jgi:DNA-binding transcriptional ArsR family regulator